MDVERRYLNWCHRQPFVLFDEDTFLESLRDRGKDSELFVALQTVSLLFPPGALMFEKRQSIESMAKESRQIAMERIRDGQIQLSTMQTLVLLSIVDFSGETLTDKQEPF